jgi:hypothetical protein
MIFSGRRWYKATGSVLRRKLFTVMQGRHRLRLFIADLQNRVMMSSVDIEISADGTSHPVRDVGFR